MTYVHELPDWPGFRWTTERLAAPLAEIHRRQGLLRGRMEHLGVDFQAETALAVFTQDVVRSSQIEGERLDQAAVRSSLARRLGMERAAAAPTDRRVEGVVEMTLDAVGAYDQGLTAQRLFAWHAALFPDGRSGLSTIAVGAWRDDARGPMQVISGPVGRETVHFEAPAAVRLDAEMRAFLDWFNRGPPMDPMLRAGLAHLWFVTLHPFDDGNGRIARAVGDMALAQGERSPQRFYSVSAAIQARRRDYYDQLERTQKGDLDITAWLGWFLDCLDRAFDGAETILASVLRKARFWETHAAAGL
ncbi:MAG: cell filamentation protein Fic, partial [Caulobacteraceae bacterium]|nr:cell filamentation protein Fic [Caulobacteraceae bacterium]